MVQTRAVTKRTEAGDPLLDMPVATVASSSEKRATDGGGDALPRKRVRFKEKPGQLCKLNLDVLCLIADYVHPLDLLNLARTCKSLRELLMDKSSAFVWKTARRQTNGLPDCPADLTEPEYAHLVFYARCESCGKYAKKILWLLRRRYCPECRRARLCSALMCPGVVRENFVLHRVLLVIEGTKDTWVDKEQLDAFMVEYRESSNKAQLLADRRERYFAIYNHAERCANWETSMTSISRRGVALRKRERYNSIFERLGQHGYQPEIAYFGKYEIKQARTHHFRTSRALTDEEWAKLWPEWSETMSKFRSERLEIVVYEPRRFLLEDEYDNYVASRPTEVPKYDLLPHTTDLARFPPFQNVISAPEAAQVSAESFEPAFEQLPALVNEWKEQLFAELAELVKIPTRYPNLGTVKLAKTPTGFDKLRLACAFFDIGYTVMNFPNLFSALRHLTNTDGAPTSLLGRFKIKFAEEAAYVVHACGLDPSVATVEDMDRRNARMLCLVCRSRLVNTWRSALQHLHWCSRPTLKHPPLKLLDPMVPRWQVLQDEYLPAVQAAEAQTPAYGKHRPLPATRCLMCRPCIGDFQSQTEVEHHLFDRHGVDKDAARLGEHFASVSVDDSCGGVEMIEGAEPGKATFRKF